jgi:Ca-activated chloride channel family protein
MQVPLSSDYQIVREFLPDLEPDYLPQGGTDYTGMLRAANDGFSQEKDADRTLFIFSDGESTTEGWRTELTRLQNRGVMIISLGVGTPDGGAVPDRDGRPSAQSRLEPAMLRSLAAGEAGIYRDVSAGLDVPALLAETVELGRKVRDAEREKLNEEDRYQWFLGLGVVLGLIGLWRELGVRPRARAIVRPTAAAASKQAQATAAALTVVVVVAILGMPRVSAHQEDADGVSEMSAAEQLQWLAHHLAWHPRLEIEDLKLMAELTINYGVQTYSEGGALEEGALRDALEAVAFGELRSPTYTNWEELRAELNRLARRDAAAEESTRPPEEPKEARDEEDAPSQTNGQGSQTTAADSIGEGGIAITDATLGELRKEAARINGSKPPAKKIQSTPGQIDVSDTVASDDPIRAILMRRYKQVTEEDSPGSLHRVLQGETTNGPAGGRDW